MLFHQPEAPTAKLPSVKIFFAGIVRAASTEIGSLPCSSGVRFVLWGDETLKNHWRSIKISKKSSGNLDLEAGIESSRMPFYTAILLYPAEDRGNASFLHRLQSTQCLCQAGHRTLTAFLSVLDLVTMIHWGSWTCHWVITNSSFKSWSNTSLQSYAFLTYNAS